MDSRGSGAFAPDANEVNEFIIVEDKGGPGGWLIIHLGPESNDIVARAKQRYWAQDIASALNKEFGRDD